MNTHPIPSHFMSVSIFHPGEFRQQSPLQVTNFDQNRYRKFPSCPVRNFGIIHLHHRKAITQSTWSYNGPRKVDNCANVCWVYVNLAPSSRNAFHCFAFFRYRSPWWFLSYHYVKRVKFNSRCVDFLFFGDNETQEKIHWRVILITAILISKRRQFIQIWNGNGNYY